MFDPENRNVLSGLKANDIVCLVSPQETIIGRFRAKEGDYVELYKPHIVVINPTASGGMGVAFMPYGPTALIQFREARWFNVNNFTQIDIAEAKAASHFQSLISGIQTPPMPGIITK